MSGTQPDHLHSKLEALLPRTTLQYTERLQTTQQQERLELRGDGGCLIHTNGHTGSIMSEPVEVETGEEHTIVLLGTKETVTH